MEYVFRKVASTFLVYCVRPFAETPLERHIRRRLAHIEKMERKAARH